jgi:hypothetical protein
MQTALLPQVSIPPSLKRNRSLSPEQVVQLRRAHVNKTSIVDVAKRFGISKQLAHKVATGQIYTDVVTPPAIAWYEPTVRQRGVHNDDELRLMVSMLRQHAGRWVLVKQTKLKPTGEPYCRWGLETSAVQIGNDSHWNLLVRWPKA